MWGGGSLQFFFGPSGLILVCYTAVFSVVTQRSSLLGLASFWSKNKRRDAPPLDTPRSSLGTATSLIMGYGG